MMKPEWDTREHGWRGNTFGPLTKKQAPASPPPSMDEARKHFAPILASVEAREAQARREKYGKFSSNRHWAPIDPWRHK